MSPSVAALAHRRIAAAVRRPLVPTSLCAFPYFPPVIAASPSPPLAVRPLHRERPSRKGAARDEEFSALEELRLPAVGLPASREYRCSRSTERDARRSHGATRHNAPNIGASSNKYEVL